MLLTKGGAEDLEIASFDVRTGFLYGHLPEEIFMEVPLGVDASAATPATPESASVKYVGIRANAHP